MSIQAKKASRPVVRQRVTCGRQPGKWLFFATFLVGFAFLACGRIQAGDRLKDQLAAGEFGPAIDDAVGIEDPLEREKTLAQIADAQREAGDFAGAETTTRRQPRKEERAREGQKTRRQKSRSGGGLNVDYDSLIDLIKETVQPENWDDAGGAGSIRPHNAGVFVDPQGKMVISAKRDPAGSLTALFGKERLASIDPDMAKSVPLRFVSLRGIEQAVALSMKQGTPVPTSVRVLGGLTRIQYLCYVPEERDLIIGGPAEGWKHLTSGQVVGVESGQPVLQLDDLVVVFRAILNGDRSNFGCSINSRDENLKRLKDFVEQSNRSGPLQPGQLRPWLRQLHDRLGQQDVVVHGVSADSRVARVLVEADYRMKLIGVGKVEGGAGIPSYFELLKQMKGVKGVPLEALRWWLTMKNRNILHDDTRTAFEFDGNSVHVMSENEFVNSQGARVPTGIAEPINRAFAENFTRNYDELAAHDFVFAELRNVLDLALAAALCKQERILDKIEWDLGVFGLQGSFQPAVMPAPRVVDSVVAHKVYGKSDIVVQAAGGVQLNLPELLSKQKSSQEVVVSTKSTGNKKWWWNSPVKDETPNASKSARR